MAKNLKEEGFRFGWNGQRFGWFHPADIDTSEFVDCTDMSDEQFDKFAFEMLQAR